VPLALRATNACRAYKAATMRPATETTATATAATWLQLQQVTATLASLKLLFAWPACISLLSFFYSMLFSCCGELGNMFPPLVCFSASQQF